ncbi:MAG TPA: Fe-S cluster assembly protein SufB [Candidatus Saccharimonadales bacterium]|nr:Fe-S cluster assembly protein SufB [Candidatus Saccharimonadales bacterium]
MGKKLNDIHSDKKKSTIEVNANYENTYGFNVKSTPVFKAQKGLNEDIVAQISDMKHEPVWMKEFRLRAYKTFLEKPMPTWGGDLSKIDFNNIFYYLKPSNKEEKTWDDVPSEIKETFDRLGIPQAEKEYLAGVKAQFDSEVVYGTLQAELQEQGVIFLGTDDALKKYPHFFEEYFGKIIPPTDNKFAALNSAVWSGGSFVYIPKGVHLKRPLQAYFRINAENMGQFERTLIIVDEGAYAHYVEGCTAPVYSADSLHSAVVEVIVKPGARFRYTTIQNWSNDVYNLVTKRARVEKDGIMEWIDGNLGSRLTMKYPSCFLVGERAHGEVLSIAYAGKGQHQDAGAKMIHIAPNTTSTIISKSVSVHGGRTSYRGKVQVIPAAKNAKSRVECDALILDEDSRSDTYPTMVINEPGANIEHEATVSKIGEEKLFYLMSRGLTEAEAMSLIVSGFIEPIVKELPLEYSLELNRLIELEMEGSVG